MLASDLIIDVRASRTITTDQIATLERTVFGSGTPDEDQLDILFLIDTYLQRRDPRWASLLQRAAMAALLLQTEQVPAKAA